MHLRSASQRVTACRQW